MKPSSSLCTVCSSTVPSHVRTRRQYRQRTAIDATTYHQKNPVPAPVWNGTNNFFLRKTRKPDTDAKINPPRTPSQNVQSYKATHHGITTVDSAPLRPHTRFRCTKASCELLLNLTNPHRQSQTIPPVPDSNSNQPIPLRPYTQSGGEGKSKQSSRRRRRRRRVLSRVLFLRLSFEQQRCCERWRRGAAATGRRAPRRRTGCCGRRSCGRTRRGSSRWPRRRPTWPWRTRRRCWRPRPPRSSASTTATAGPTHPGSFAPGSSCMSNVRLITVYYSTSVLVSIRLLLLPGRLALSTVPPADSFN
jgi:hypothetical protein